MRTLVSMPEEDCILAEDGGRDLKPKLQASNRKQRPQARRLLLFLADDQPRWCRVAGGRGRDRGWGVRCS